MTETDSPVETPGLRKPYAISDLMLVTGWGRDKVKRCIREGLLPGYVEGRTYTVPAEAFERFVRGEWRPMREVA